MIVLILCAGDRHRWEINEKVVQQFLPITGTTILRRIVAQVRKHGYEPIIITRRDDIKNHVSDVEFFEPALHMNIADTWYHTRELWKEHTTILFGDVIYGEITIEKVLEYRGDLLTIGNSAEVFAFMFSEADHEKLVATLDAVRKAQKFWEGAPGRIYRHWCGIGPHDSNKSKAFKWPWDRTADVDSISEYREALTVWGR